eukprot:5508706-Amphidinium_carterae.1
MLSKTTFGHCAGSSSIPPQEGFKSDGKERLAAQDLTYPSLSFDLLYCWKAHSGHILHAPSVHDYHESSLDHV